MRRNSGSSFTISGAYTSPGTPEYGDCTYSGLPKGWCSERVPLPTYSSRRHVSSTALMPFNSGRTLPSKWDDAERWITSPLSGFGSFKNSVAQPQRRPKSKSGPLGPSGLDYLPGHSPPTPVKGGIVRGGFMANSPLTTGVLVPDGLSVHYESGAGAESSSLFDNINMTRSVSVPGLSNLLSETCVPISQDEKLYGAMEEAAYVSRRDMATQMSPEGSTHSSSKGRLSFSTLPSSISTSVCLHRNPAGKDDIRDVQVDKGTTTARGSKNQGLKKMESSSVENMSSSWDVSEASKSISKLRREEAKITAWENLQKAKAEAAIRKLEMKLEKKRSASMDKITNKLRASQMKAEAMRHTAREQSHIRAHKSHPVSLRICSVFNCLFCLN